MSQPLSNALQDLLTHWQQEQPRRAWGGFWALSGFAFQISTFLLTLFRNIEEHGSEPGQFAEMEQLSDIVSPQDGRFTLIQVKRTLDRSTLLKAVEEAYHITDLCLQRTPLLTEHLKFQIVCRTLTTSLTPRDLSMTDVIPQNGNSATWNTMLALFDTTTPTIDDVHQLDQLHVFLWNVGVKNTTALVDQCVGRIIQSYDVRDRAAMRAVGRDLTKLYEDAPRHSPWIPAGLLLSREDVASDPSATNVTAVLTGQSPKFEHLRKHMVRERPRIFPSLWGTFRQWYSTRTDTVVVMDTPDLIPVFWISGRSGEGKSVLLLQLIAKLMHEQRSESVLFLRTPNDLPRLLETLPVEAYKTPASFGPIFAVIDDIYNVRNRDDWDDSIRSACAFRTPPIAIITCGPTEQLEQFNSRLRDQVHVTNFEVPHLTVQEGLEFEAWYAARTGQNRSSTLMSLQNPLLVQVMFELAQGVSLPAFARRFKHRLSLLGLFEATRAILATNALYLDAPLALVTSAESQDALERLCAEDQLHFHIVRDDALAVTSVRLAHAHLAWLLFTEWLEPPTRLAKGWARELAAVLEISGRDSTGIYGNALLNQVLTTPRLSDDGATSSPATADRHELIEELYRLHVASQGGYPHLLTLPRWLEMTYRLPELKLQPDPFAYTVTTLQDELKAFRLSGSVIYWGWLIAITRGTTAAHQFRVAAQDFALRFPQNPYVGRSLSLLFRGTRNNMVSYEFAIEWLEQNTANPKADELLVAVVDQKPHDEPAEHLAYRWLVANRNHPRAGLVFAALLRARPNDAATFDRALHWLSGDPTSPQTVNVHIALTKAKPTDASSKALALQWLTDNGGYIDAASLLSSLVKTNPADDTIMDYALSWLTTYSDHRFAHHVLAALVAANPGNGVVVEEALGWVDDNPTHPEGPTLLAALVSAYPGDKMVMEQAHSWLADHVRDPIAFNLIVPMTKANPADSLTLTRARTWLAEHSTNPQAYNLLTQLLKQHTADAALVDLALFWLGTNTSNPQAYQLLLTLVKQQAHDLRIKRASLDWLEANSNHPQHHRVLGQLAKAYPHDSVIIKRTLAWFSANPDHPQAGTVLVTLGKANPSNPSIKQLVLQWVQANPAHPQFHDILAAAMTTYPRNRTLTRIARAWLASHLTERQSYLVLAPLVQTHPGHKRIIETALKWLDTRGTSTQAQQVVQSLVAANPGHSRIIDRACAWLVTNPHNRESWQVVVSLVKANAHDPSVMAHAHQWLRSNSSHEQAFHVLGGMVKADRSDPVVLNTARNWLRSHESREGYAQLLATLISSTAGSEEWVRQGERYLTQPDCREPYLVLGALVSTAGADPVYIDRAIDLIEHTNIKYAQEWLFNRLAYEIVRNPARVAHYMTGSYSEQHKDLFCYAVSLAFKNDVTIITQFISDIAPQIPTRYTSLILCHAIEMQIESHDLDASIVERLSKQASLHDESMLLHVIKDNPMRLKRLRSFELPPHISAVLDTLAKAYSRR